MAVIDRERTDGPPEPGTDDGRPLEAEEPPAAVPLAWPLRILLAACLSGAAAIHLAMVPSHAGEWLAEGVAFAVVGWSQLALAVIIVLRPSRPALEIVIGANLAVVAAWVWTRTAGAPFGPEAGSAHAARFVDIVCVVLEIAAVLAAGVALARPRSGAAVPRSWAIPLSIVPVGILVLATVAITSPSASGHAHGETAAGAHAADGGDGDAHTHDGETIAAGAAATDEHAVAGDGHGHGAAPTDGTPVDDKGLAALSNGEMAHEYGPDAPLDADTRAVLVHQLALTRSIAERFPTLGDAIAAGSRPAGGYNPGMGIHMTTPTSGMPEAPPPDPSLPTIPGTLSDAEILRPANLLYDGSHDDARLAGFMYYSMSPEEPAGFAGPNDHWHTHGSLCIVMGDGIEVLHPHENTAPACQAAGGMFVERTSFMVHVWTIPGYESNRGVFSDINPSLACPDGTYHTVPLEETEKYQLNKCRSNPE